MKINNLEIARRFKLLREKHGVSQRELAKKLEVSHPTIGHYESGDKNIQIEFLIKFVNYFNVDLNYFQVPLNKLSLYDNKYKKLKLDIEIFNEIDIFIDKLLKLRLKRKYIGK